MPLLLIKFIIINVFVRFLRSLSKVPVYLYPGFKPQIATQLQWGCVINMLFFISISSISSALWCWIFHISFCFIHASHVFVVTFCCGSFLVFLHWATFNTINSIWSQYNHLVLCITILISTLTNQQIRHQITHKVGCQIGNCRWPLNLLQRFVWVCMGLSPLCQIHLIIRFFTPNYILIIKFHFVTITWV